MEIRMKAIIVDDEILVRAGMKMIIPWNTLGFEITGEAANAEEAIGMAIEQQPDLMLVDITMPGMSGLEMISILQSRLYHCDYIILSCHSEVTYLKEAIRLGVTDYIIKDSLNPKEITATLETVIRNKNKKESIQSLEIENQREREQIFLLAGEESELTIKELAIKLKVEGNETEYFILVVETYKHSDIGTIIRICEEIIKEYAVITPFYCNDNKVTFLVGTAHGESTREMICHRCLETLAQTFDIIITLGASESTNGNTPYVSLLEMASDALQMKYIRGNGKFYLYSKAEALKTERAINSRREELKDIRSIYQLAELQIYVNQIDECVRKANFIPYAMVINVLSELFYFINDLLKKELGFSCFAFLLEEMPVAIIDKILSYETIYQKLTFRMEEIKDHIKKYPNANVMGQIVLYIDKNIENKILLEDIAGEVHLSRTYISTLFKKEMKININDYITTQKLAYAKELLLKGESVSVAADRIGVQSESYFVKLFKKQYNVTPAKFAKENRF